MAAQTEPRTPREYLRPDVLARLGGLELRARAVVEGFVSGIHSSPYRGQSVEFAEHREYAQGDDLRHIDWRVWGRADRYYIKQYEEETNMRVLLAVDVSASMRYPEHADAGRMTKFEYAATLAASLAFLLTHQADAVGLALFDDALRAELPALSNPAHVRAIVGRLESARLERSGDTRVLTRDLAKKARPRSLVVLISDLLFDLADLVECLDRLRFDRHDVIVMHVLDDEERRFPFQGFTRFESLEGEPMAVDVDPPSLRQAYLASLREFTSAAQAACVNRQIDFVELSTIDPLDVALRRYLAARTRLRRQA